MMSRIQDALRRAEEHRGSRSQAGPEARESSMRLDDEVREFEASLTAWRARPAEPAVEPAQHPPSVFQQGQETAPLRAIVNPWDEDIRRCRDALAACEARVARARRQQKVLHTQVREQECVVAEAATHLHVLQQGLKELEDGVRRTEAERSAEGERLLALRQCQALAQAAAEADQRLQANTEAMARMARVQQRVSEKLSQQQEEADALRSAAAELRQQLAEALERARSSVNLTAHGDRRNE